MQSNNTTIFTINQPFVVVPQEFRKCLFNKAPNIAKVQF